MPFYADVFPDISSSSMIDEPLLTCLKEFMEPFGTNAVVW